MSEPGALTPASAAPRAVAAPWPARLQEQASAYLPLLLMGVLALGTWWLVKSTPLADADRVPAAPRHEPDYTMAQFKVQRYAPAGGLRVQIEGDELRHYPDNDTIEVDNARIRMFGADGHATLATARRALSNADASEVQLLGGAHVVREATAQDEAIEFRSEFLHAFLNTERVTSHLPVTVHRGATEVRAEGMDYDNVSRVVAFKGRARATFAPSAGRGRR